MSLVRCLMIVLALCIAPGFAHAAGGAPLSAAAAAHAQAGCGEMAMHAGDRHDVERPAAGHVCPCQATCAGAPGAVPGPAAWWVEAMRSIAPPPIAAEAFDSIDHRPPVPPPQFRA